MKLAKREAVHKVRRQHCIPLKDERIPIRPPGYFAKCYSRAEIREQNCVAKASVIRVPNDLE